MPVRHTTLRKISTPDEKPDLTPPPLCAPSSCPAPDRSPSAPPADRLFPRQQLPGQHLQRAVPPPEARGFDVRAIEKIQTPLYPVTGNWPHLV
jgi:hypothetical protein